MYAYWLPGDLLAHANRTLADGECRELLGGMRAEKHHHAAAKREADAGGAKLLVRGRCFTKLRELAVLVVDERIQTSRHAGAEHGEPTDRLDARPAAGMPGHPALLGAGGLLGAVFQVAGESSPGDTQG